MQIKFIDEIRTAWKLYSVQAMAVLAFLAGLESIWGTVSWLVPEKWHPLIVAVIAVAGLLGRLLRQDDTVTEGEVKKANAFAAKTAELAAQVEEAPTLGERLDLAKARDVAKAEYDRIVLLINSKQAGTERVENAKSL